MLKVEFPCENGSEVTVKLTKVVGVVKAWYIDVDGVKYASVTYADTTKAVHTEWIREDELTI